MSGLIACCSLETQNVFFIQGSSSSTLHQLMTTTGLTTVTRFHFSCFSWWIISIRTTCSTITMTDLNLVKTSSDVIQAPVIIAVMGLTGSGKSTFVQKASGLQNIEIGHNLNSCR